MLYYLCDTPAFGPYRTLPHPGYLNSRNQFLRVPSGPLMLRYTICKLRAFLHFLMEGRSDYVLQHRHETNEIVCQVCSKNSRVHTSIRLCVIMNGEIVHSIFRTKHLLIYISWLFLLIDLESIKPRGLRCEGRNGSLAPPLILLRVLQMTKTPSCDLESLECKVNPVISYLRVIQP